MKTPVKLLAKRKEKEEEILKRGLEKGREEWRALVISQLLQAGSSMEQLNQALNLEGGTPSVN